MSRKLYILEGEDDNGSFYGIYRGPLREDPLKRKFYFRSTNASSENNAQTLARVYAEGFTDGQGIKDD